MSDACVILIAGPTASGKSAAAMKIARSRGGEIVNADAIQVYKDLRVVTARPTPEDEAAVPHHLYGAIDGVERCSAGRWARLARNAIENILESGKTAVVVGGTGLYFRALEHGLSPIPEIPSTVRDAARARRAALGAAAFKEEVVERDPEMARLAEADAQRLQRAWEVFEATGRPLSYFQSLPGEPLFTGAAARVVIEPARDTLYANCDLRAAAMVTAGAIEEVRALVARDLDPSLPVMKALGVPEIGAYLRAEANEAEMLASLQQNTRRFAKRQLTWFRNQTPDWPRAPDAAAAMRIVDA